MPMLILRRACFIHIPKTGGTWVREAMRASGIHFTEHEIEGNAHIGVNECRLHKEYKFAFVRHPVELYRSYWQYKMTYGWDANSGFDEMCKDNNFQRFIVGVTQKYPGIYGRCVSDLIGEAGENIDFVGRYENLSEDLIMALAAAGEDFDEQMIRKTEPCNVSDKARFPAKYTARLEETVMESECRFMRQFKYI